MVFRFFAPLMLGDALRQLSAHIRLSVMEKMSSLHLASKRRHLEVVRYLCDATGGNHECEWRGSDSINDLFDCPSRRHEHKEACVGERVSCRKRLLSRAL